MRKDKSFKKRQDRKGLMRKKRKKRKKKKVMIEVRTTKWKLVELLEHRGKFLVVKLDTGEIIRHHPHNKVRWGKTKRITKGMMSFGGKKKT